MAITAIAAIAIMRPAAAVLDMVHPSLGCREDADGGDRGRADANGRTVYASDMTAGRPERIHIQGQGHFFRKRVLTAIWAPGRQVFAPLPGDVCGKLPNAARRR